MEKLPAFLVIGAARSGTTALYRYMKQHPGIFLSPVKETNYFAFAGESLQCAGPGADYINNSLTTLDQYREQFQEAGEDQAIGEVCPLYLYSERAPARIREQLPAVRLLAILRNPVEQAFSHYLYARRQMLEPLDDFEQALDMQAERKALGWQPLFQYSRFPRYHEQLRRYLDCFPRERMQIVLYEDFVSEPGRVLREMFEFIGVDSAFEPDTAYRPNAGGVPKNRYLQDLVMKPSRLGDLVGPWIPEELKRRIRDAVSSRNLSKPELSAGARERLQLELRDDMEQLADLIGRDLGAWLG